MNKTLQNWLSKLAVVVLLFAAIYIFLKLEPIWAPIFKVFLAVFIPFFIAAFITYLLYPIIEFIHRLGIPRSLAVLIIYILFFGGVGFGIFKVSPYALKQLRELNEHLPQLADTYQMWIKEFYEHTSDLPETVHTRFEEWLQTIEVYIGNIITKIIMGLKVLLNSMFTLLVIPFLVFYMLKDMEVIYKAIWYLTPRKWREPGKKLMKDIDISLGNYIRGQFFVCLSLAVIAILAFWGIGMPYPILLGIIIGITDIIPYFGPILGAVPVVIIASTISIKILIIAIGIVLVLQFIEGNILGPLIVGKSLRIHPILIILALFLGGEIGGIIGLILAVPVFAVIKVILLHLRDHMIKC